MSLLPSAEDITRVSESGDIGKWGSIDDFAAALGSSLEDGLDQAHVERSQERFGANRLPRKKLRGFLSHLVECFEDTTLLILIFSAVTSLLYGVFVTEETADIVQGGAILIAVVVVSGVTSIQNWQKDREFASLNAIKADRTVNVVRDGEQREVSVHELVVGDVLLVEAGDALPCDGLLFRGFDVEVDESSLTGESHLVEKRPNADALLHGGSEVKTGLGRMLVVAVGVHSMYGRIVLNSEHEEPPPTPLQDKLEDLANQIGYVGMLAGGLTFLILLATWFTAADPETRRWIDVLQFFIVGISIVVVAVPEGLPLAVTISLAFSMQRMLKDMNLVRQLKACETVGSATVIASDKTGTLTENRMSVVTGWFFHREVDQMHDLREIVADNGALTSLGRAIGVNSSGWIENMDEPRPHVIGNQTEGALLHMMHKFARINPFPFRKNARVLYQRPFSSDRKMMTTVCLPHANEELAPERPEDDLTVYVKGAPEVLLPHCSRVAHPDGTETPLDGSARDRLYEDWRYMCSKGLRTVLVAHRRMRWEDSPQDDEERWSDLQSSGELEQDLVVLAIAGIKDPVRDQVPAAVRKVQRAGIRVLMVTGDAVDTAKFIAEECGILREGGLVMEGSEFRALPWEEKRAAATRLQVMARSLPSDKHDLVLALIENDEVVAVTGDGTNDAPALRAAHVGLSMGISGTEVAREASDIVIMDDNFASIVLSVRWGRSILENVRKFLTFQLTINTVALLLTIVVACTAGGASSRVADAFPLTPVQLLWVNLIMDSFAALALATEPPSDKLLQRRPEGRKRGLITPLMWRTMAGHAVFQSALLLFLLYGDSLNWLEVAVEGRSSTAHHTMVFNIFVLLQVFNMLNCRKIHGEHEILEDFGQSSITHMVLAVILIGQVFIVECGGELAQTVPLSSEQWAKCFVLGFLSIPVGFIVRLIDCGLSDKYLDSLPPESGASTLPLPQRLRERVVQQEDLSDSGTGEERSSGRPRRRRRKL